MDYLCLAAMGKPEQRRLMRGLQPRPSILPFHSFPPFVSHRMQAIRLPENFRLDPLLSTNYYPGIGGTLPQTSRLGGPSGCSAPGAKARIATRPSSARSAAANWPVPAQAVAKR
jgi:hypothetical protein